MSKAIDDKKAIHIAIAFDKNYVRLCLIFLASLFKSNARNRLVIHAIATDVTPEKKAEISDYANQHGHQFVFYNIKPADLEGLVIHKDSHLTLATYYRLFFPALIPADIDKLIYTDVDIININSLSELYDIDLGTKPVGAECCFKR